MGGTTAIDAQRLVPNATITSNPTVFLGYSDATVSHFAWLKARVMSFYGPTIMSGFAENCGIMETTRLGVAKVLFGLPSPVSLCPERDGWASEFLDWADPANQRMARTRYESVGPVALTNEDKLEGHLIGGCMESILDLVDTEFWPDKQVFNGSLLFLESSNDIQGPLHYLVGLEKMEKLGILGRVSAVLLGRTCRPTNADETLRVLSLLRTRVDHLLGRDSLPIMANLDFGHTQPSLTFPIGARASVDCRTGTIILLEDLTRSF